MLLFQAMDAAGKDGAIRHITSGVNPRGCRVFSFKHPGAVELEHDLLWRTTRDLPKRGRIGIFEVLEPAYPKVDARRRRELQAIRRHLAHE